MGGLASWGPDATQVWEVAVLEMSNLNQAEREQATTHEQQLWPSGTFS